MIDETTIPIGLSEAMGTSAEGLPSQNPDFKPVKVGYPDEKNPDATRYYQGYQTDALGAGVTLETLSDQFQEPGPRETSSVTHLFLETGGKNKSVYVLTGTPSDDAQQKVNWSLQGARTPGNLMDVYPDTIFKVGEPFKFVATDKDRLLIRRSAPITRILALSGDYQDNLDQGDVTGEPTDLVDRYRQIASQAKNRSD